MKRIVLILLTTIAFSCAERELQLPVTTNNDVTEILDVSPVYLFYDEATDSVDFNRKNMISTTNWLVNIDKRLTLKQILPHLQYLQEKRRGDGMHKNENAKNYFTCFNEDTKSLSFIEFTDLKYKAINENERIMSNDLLDDGVDLNALKKFENLDDPLQVRFDRVIIESNDKILQNNTTFSFSEFIQYNLKYSLENYGALFLVINSELDFQDYIKIKSSLKEIESDKLKVSDYEVIYN
jgi:hypothetical protein